MGTKLGHIGSGRYINSRETYYPNATPSPVGHYVEVFYNQERRHSTLGYMSPGEFERAAGMEQAAA